MEMMRYDKARHAIQEAHSVDDVNKMMAQAEAMQAYAKQINDNEIETWVAEIKLRAMRKFGELSSRLDKTNGKYQSPSGGTLVTKKEILKQAGTTTQKASRCEKLAAIPSETIEKVIAYAKEKNKPVTYADVYIDAKTRKKGCGKYWLGEPEVAIELWSVIPENGKNGKPGWTLDESKITDLIMYTFDQEDCNEVFLLSFQMLRIAARKNIKNWMNNFKVDIQSSYGKRRSHWRSKAVFVPIPIVFNAIQDAQRMTF